MARDTLLRRVRKYCLECCCNSSKEVTFCPCICTLHPYRSGARPETVMRRLKAGKTPAGRKCAGQCVMELQVAWTAPRMPLLKAVHKHCLECSGGSWKEVAECPITHCLLFEFRFGARPETVKRRLKEGKTPLGRVVERRRSGANVDDTIQRNAP